MESHQNSWKLQIQADDSEAEFQPDDEQENVINKDLEGRTVSLVRWN